MNNNNNNLCISRFIRLNNCLFNNQKIKFYNNQNTEIDVSL